MGSEGADGPWEPVPWWHYRRWFGYSWMRWRNPPSSMHHDPEWEYQTHDQRAREILREQFE